MAVTFRGGSSASSGNTTATSITIPLPAGWQAGDVAIASVAYPHVTADTPPPTGWTRIAGPITQASNLRSFVFAKELAPGDTGITLGSSLGATRLTGVMAVVGGVQLADLVVTSAAAATASSWTSPAITVAAESALLNLWHLRASASTAPPLTIATAGNTVDATAVTTGNSPNYTAVASHRDVTVTGTPSGTNATSVTSSVSILFSIGVRVKATLPVLVAPAGVSSPAAVGAPLTRVRPRLAPASVGSTGATGTPALSVRPHLTPGGIAAAGGLGSPLVEARDDRVKPVGIVSDATVGTPVVVVIQPVRLDPESIASGDAFGEPLVYAYVLQDVVPYPSGERIAEFLDAPDDDRLIALATVHVGVITQFARVYARGNGFFVQGLEAELEAVVVAATARLVSNPEQLSITVGNVTKSNGFKGWTLAERIVLNQYRGVAR